MGIGEHLGDASRAATGSVLWSDSQGALAVFTECLGVFYGEVATTLVGRGGTVNNGQSTVFRKLLFDISRVMPVAKEIRPASISCLACISY